MVTAVGPQHVVLGGLHCGSLAIHIYDWSQLEGDSDKAGDDLVIPGRAGVLVQDGPNDEPRFPAAHHANLFARVDGFFTKDNLTYTAGDRIDHYYELLDELQTVTRALGVQTISVEGPSGTKLSEDCIVESPGVPRRELPWRAELVIGVMLPDGPATILTEGS